MQSDSGESVSTVSQDRQLLGLAARYLLDVVSQVAPVFEGDILLGLTFATIVRGSVEHLEPKAAPLKVQGVFPDGVRRPVTIAAVARSLGLPRETARRYVHRLIAMNFCRPVGARGVIVPAEVIRSERFTQIARSHSDALRDLCETVQRSGG
jgi:hypothetical protein